MSDSDAQSLPDRYQLTEVTTTAFDNRRRYGVDARIHVPEIILTSWLDMTRGDYFSNAPRDEDSVLLGPQTPPIISKMKIPDQKPMRAYVGADVIRYLGVDPDEVITFEQMAENEVVCRVNR